MALLFWFLTSGKGKLTVSLADGKQNSGVCIENKPISSKRKLTFAGKRVC